MIPLMLLSLALLTVPPGQAAQVRLTRLSPTEPHAPVARCRSGWWLPMLCGVAFGLPVASIVGGWSDAVLATAVAAGTALGCRWMARRAAVDSPDPLALAAGWDLLTACLRAGLPVPLAVRASAAHLPRAAGEELRMVAERLALGAPAQSAWDLPATSAVHKLARAARRSAHSGAGLAEVATRAAAEIRAGVREAAAARGQRAAVLITGPLGLCYLPAFLALGVVPVVIGLAGGLAWAW